MLEPGHQKAPLPSRRPSRPLPNARLHRLASARKAYHEKLAARDMRKLSRQASPEAFVHYCADFSTRHMMTVCDTFPLGQPMLLWAFRWDKVTCPECIRWRPS